MTETVRADGIRPGDGVVYIGNERIDFSVRDGWLTSDPRWVGSLRAWMLGEAMRKAWERFNEAWHTPGEAPRWRIDVDAALSVPIPRPTPEGDLVVRRALARAMGGRA